MGSRERRRTAKEELAIDFDCSASGKAMNKAYGGGGKALACLRSFFLYK